MAALVLLSGGLDSTVAAALHRAAGGDLALALFVDYGQRAAAPEARAAEAVAGALGCPFLVTALPLLGELPGGALTDRDSALPAPGPGGLEGEEARASAAAVWVPNRNGLLVHLAAAVAEARGLDEVVVGFNREEAQTFPDNGVAFVRALNASLALSTRNGVRVVGPTLELTKAELVAAGRRVGAPLELAWSCYEAGPEPCGRCESCRRRERAEGAAG